MGPSFGGITIDGGGTLELIDAEDTSLGLENLTLADGSTGGGGALFAADSEIGIFNCTFRDNGTLNLEVADLDTSALGLGGSNPWRSDPHRVFHCRNRE